MARRAAVTSLVDLDPQFALTRRFGTSPAAAQATAFEPLAGHGSLSDAVAAAGPRLGLLAGHRDLAKLELSLAGEHHREEFVHDLLSSEAVGYDVVLIDCPPNLGLLTVSAIVGGLSPFMKGIVANVRRSMSGADSIGHRELVALGQHLAGALHGRAEEATAHVVAVALGRASAARREAPATLA